MLPIARSIWEGGRRLTGVSVLHPAGDPQLAAAQEAELRYRLLERALGVLAEMPA